MSTERLADNDAGVYLDHAATGPIRPTVADAMASVWSEQWANPAASHRAGRDARRTLDDARERIAEILAVSAADVVITSGGTGLTGRDGTPEAVAPLLDKTIEGFGELFRVLSFESIGTSTLQSRCLAGVANGTFVFVLPGSLDAVTTAWNRLIRAQLDADTRPSNLAQLRARLKE